MEIAGLFTSVKGFVSKSINQLDEIATLDEQKWRKRISTLQSTIATELTSKKPQPKKSANPLAGSDLLYKYELEWVRIHQANQILTTRASDLDELITKTLRICESYASKFSKFHSTLSNIPKIRAETSKAQTLIASLGKQMLDLEVMADELELLLEKRNLKAWEASQNDQLNQHFSDKTRELKAREFLLKKERETFEITLNSEKQKTAEEAFQQDVEQFMKDPKPRSLSVASAMSAKSMDEELKEALNKMTVAEKEEEELAEFLNYMESPEVTQATEDLQREREAERDAEEEKVDILRDADYDD